MKIQKMYDALMMITLGEKKKEEAMLKETEVKSLMKKSEEDLKLIKLKIEYIVNRFADFGHSLKKLKDKEEELTSIICKFKIALGGDELADEKDDDDDDDN